MSYYFHRNSAVQRLQNSIVAGMSVLSTQILMRMPTHLRILTF